MSFAEEVATISSVASAIMAVYTAGAEAVTVGTQIYTDVVDLMESIKSSTDSDATKTEIILAYLEGFWDYGVENYADWKEKLSNFMTNVYALYQKAVALYDTITGKESD